MKKKLQKLFCLTFAVALCVGNVCAQNQIDVEGWTYSGISKSYDRQSQGSVYPMTQRHDDGFFIGSTWTNEDNPPFSGSNTPLRGIGYAYSTDGGRTWSEPENRVGGIPLYWPSYAQWGANGEAILGRSAATYEYNGIQILDGLVLLTRENKGEGEWGITPVPYPEGAPAGTSMMWARMTTSGPNHQYIHIMSPMSDHSTPYKGYIYPNLYYRTQDGKTWDISGVLVPWMVGELWHEKSNYADAISFAVQGNTVVCSFINWANHGYVLRSRDNGDTWEHIKFFDTPVYENATYDEIAYIPKQGCIALDNFGKIHIAFSVIASRMGGETPYYGGGELLHNYTYSFLSYWNEDMKPINGAVDFRAAVIAPKVFEYFDLDQSNDNKLYIKSKIPEWPIIGYYTPIMDDNLFSINKDIINNWAIQSYGWAGCFSFPQMAFDKNNVLHLVYLGLLDGGQQGDHWLRHPFYTTSLDGGLTWTKTEYLVNRLDFIDKEFAYLTLAGLGDNKMYLMAQVDDKAGVYESYTTNFMSDHSPTDNYFRYFSITGIPTQSIEHYENSSLKMSIFPNPATGQATVKFEGKGNITVTTMFGQTIYHLEDVENETQISLQNMNAGIYFVTVRSENSVATQKLVVK